MPLPLLLWGAAALVGAAGVAMGVSGNADLKRAKEIGEESQTKHKDKIEETNTKQQNTLKLADGLTLSRNEMYQFITNSFLPIVKKYQQVNTKELKQAENINAITLSNADIKNFETKAIQSIEIVGTITKGIASGGALAGGVFASVALLGTASTGTAIATLSGAAATNAALAAIGGGSLAAGGAGIAGGMMALGGIVAAPALAIGGFMLASKGEKALTQAYEYETKVDVACEKLNVAIEGFKAIDKRINEISDTSDKLFERLASATKYLADQDSSIKERSKKRQAAELEEAKQLQNTEEAKAFAKIFFLKKWFMYIFRISPLTKEELDKIYTPTKEILYKTSDLTQEELKAIKTAFMLGKALKETLEVSIVDDVGKMALSKTSEEAIENGQKILQIA